MASSMDRYKKVEVIGNGGGSLEVQRVREETTGRFFAMKKVLLGGCPVDKGAMKEVEALVKLNHRNIVGYVESFQVECYLHIVMPYYAGGDLYQKIEKKKLQYQNSGTSFTEDEILNIMKQLCQAVDYAHTQHIVHRDIKPRNIFFADDGTLKLGDFGIAKILDSTQGVANTPNVGTLQYTAPEVFAGQPYTNKCDMWSLGCVMYELVTLNKPFGGNDMILRISNANYDPLPPYVKSIFRIAIVDLIQKEASKRSSATEVLNQIQMAYRLNFLLMGKTGHGKSAVGNSILGRREFRTSPSPIPMEDIYVSFAEFGNYILQVVDTPGLAATDESQQQNIETAVENMNKAFILCYGGVQAFLFVLKFGNRFTAEEMSTLESLKQIFGPRYMDHVIVVVTHGDIFLSAVEAGECKNDFHSWCRQQGEAFYQLYEDCAGRFVLFNNRERDARKYKAQIHELVELAKCLRDRYGCYTFEYFRQAERERRNLIVKLRAP